MLLSLADFHYISVSFLFFSSFSVGGLMDKASYSVDDDDDDDDDCWLFNQIIRSKPLCFVI